MADEKGHSKAVQKATTSAEKAEKEFDRRVREEVEKRLLLEKAKLEKQHKQDLQSLQNARVLVKQGKNNDDVLLERVGNAKAVVARAGEEFNKVLQAVKSYRGYYNEAKKVLNELIGSIEKPEDIDSLAFVVAQPSISSSESLRTIPLPSDLLSESKLKAAKREKAFAVAKQALLLAGCSDEKVEMILAQQHLQLQEISSSSVSDENFLFLEDQEKKAETPLLEDKSRKDSNTDHEAGKTSAKSDRGGVKNRDDHEPSSEKTDPEPSNSLKRSYSTMSNNSSSGERNSGWDVYKKRDSDSSGNRGAVRALEDALGVSPPSQNEINTCLERLVSQRLNLPVATVMSSPVPKLLLSFLKENIEVPDLVANGCKFFSFLSSDRGWEIQLVDLGLLEFVFDAVRAHPQSQWVFAAGVSAFWNMTTEESHKQKAIDGGLVEILLDSLRFKTPGIRFCIFGAVANIVTEATSQNSEFVGRFSKEIMAVISRDRKDGTQARRLLHQFAEQPASCKLMAEAGIPKDLMGLITENPSKNMKVNQENGHLCVAAARIMEHHDDPIQAALVLDKAVTGLHFSLSPHHFQSSLAKKFIQSIKYLASNSTVQETLANRVGLDLLRALETSRLFDVWDHILVTLKLLISKDSALEELRKAGLVKTIVQILKKGNSRDHVSLVVDALSVLEVIVKKNDSVRMELVNAGIVGIIRTVGRGFPQDHAIQVLGDLLQKAIQM